MKVTVFDGTAEEFLKVRTVLTVDENTEQSTPHNGSHALPEAAINVLNSISATNPAARRLAQEFLAGNFAFAHDIEVRLSKPQRQGGPRIRLHRVGSNVGAYAILNPRRQRILLRLDASDVPQGVTHGGIRKVQPTDPYQVRVLLTTEAAKEEALKLARTAYDKA